MLAAPNRITVVSGLPRSGTSLVMQILDAAGLSIATDGLRSPDLDNPRGYFELSAVKRIRSDARFLGVCVGRVVKIVAPLLLELPPDYAYRVVFVERELGEVLASQRAMLERQGGAASGAFAGADDERIAQGFQSVLDRCHRWLARSPATDALYVAHRSFIESPKEAVSRIARFLEQTGEGAGGGDCDAASARRQAAMVRAVDASLYRSRGGS